MVLGTRYDQGEVPAVTVPTNNYKAIRLSKGVGHALMVNVLTPAWVPNRVKIGPDPSFLTTYEGTLDRFW